MSSILQKRSMNKSIFQLQPSTIPPWNANGDPITMFLDATSNYYSDPTLIFSVNAPVNYYAQKQPFCIIQKGSFIFPMCSTTPQVNFEAPNSPDYPARIALTCDGVQSRYWGFQGTSLNVVANLGLTSLIPYTVGTQTYFIATYQLQQNEIFQIPPGISVLNFRLCSWSNVQSSYALPLNISNLGTSNGALAVSFTTRPGFY